MTINSFQHVNESCTTGIESDMSIESILQRLNLLVLPCLVQLNASPHKSDELCMEHVREQWYIILGKDIEGT